MCSLHIYAEHSIILGHPEYIDADADQMAIKGCRQNIQKLERGSKMRLFETNGDEAIDSPTPRNEAKTPYCKRYNPVMELTTVGARGQVCTYGIPVVIRLRKHEMRDN